jgi:hypothetical protein
MRLEDAIGDYDCVVDNPEKHLPYAIFCTTNDAMRHLKDLKESSPEIDWKVMTLDDWQRQYKGHINDA